MVQSLPGFTPRCKGPCEDPRGCPKAKEVGGSTAMGGAFQRLGLRHLSPSCDDGCGAAVVCVCGRGPKVCPRLNPAVASPFGEHLWLLVFIKASAKLLSVTSLISPRLSKSCYRRHSPGCWNEDPKISLVDGVFLRPDNLLANPSLLVSMTV